MDETALTTAPWDVEYTDFPHEGTIDERVQFLLRYAILAPSSHNSQPWAFDVRSDELDVFAETSRALDVADADGRELYISIGCAIENFLVAAEHFGFGWDVEYLPPGPDDRVALVSLTPDSGTSDRDPALFRALTDRRTNHDVFEDRPIAEDSLARIRDCTDEASEVTVHLVTDADQRQRIAELQMAADRRLFDDPAYRRELGRWIGTGALGASWLMSRVGQLAVEHLDFGTREGKQNSKLLRSAPAIAVLTTETSDRTAELDVGEVFERMALRATADGVAVHPMSQILEVPDLRAELAALLDLGDEIPQHLCRLGHAPSEPAHTPRLPLESVLRE